MSVSVNSWPWLRRAELPKYQDAPDSERADELGYADEGNGTFAAVDGTILGRIEDGEWRSVAATPAMMVGYGTQYLAEVCDQIDSLSQQLSLGSGTGDVLREDLLYLVGALRRDTDWAVEVADDLVHGYQLERVFVPDGMAFPWLSAEDFAGGDADGDWG